MAITDWPLQERPRERLLQNGPSVLSDAELLAIFLRTGIPGKSAVDLARELIQEFGGLRPLLEADLSRFCQGRGLGSAKFAQLQAVLEMSRRHWRETLQRGNALQSPQETRAYLLSELRDSPNEVFACLFMDNRHRILRFEKMFHGTINSASVYPREIVRKSLQFNAAAVIVAHNHPSGVAEPSEADQRLTRRLSQALELIDVRLLDHCIVGDGHVVSMAERGQL